MVSQQIRASGFLIDDVKEGATGLDEGRELTYSVPCLMMRGGGAAHAAQPAAAFDVH